MYYIYLRIDTRYVLCYVLFVLSRYFCWDDDTKQASRIWEEGRNVWVRSVGLLYRRIAVFGMNGELFITHFDPINVV